MKYKFILLISIIGISLGAIAYLSSRETSFTIVDTNDVAVNPKKFEGDNLRVRGNVKLGTLTREGKQAKFQLELNDKILDVHFTGKTLLPDAFKEGAKARVDGKLVKGVLVADHVEAKCASKYEAEYSK